MKVTEPPGQTLVLDGETLTEGAVSSVTVCELLVAVVSVQRLQRAET